MNNLPFDLINTIYLQLIVFDKFNFIKLNKQIYKYFKIEIKKYKIFIHLNNNYQLFYYFLQNNTYLYNELVLLFKRSIIDMPHVSRSNLFSFYDMRYIYELLQFNKSIGDNKLIQKYNNHFYVHFYNRLLSCIDGNRKKSPEEYVL